MYIYIYIKHIQKHKQTVYLRGCYIHGELSTQATATERRKVAGTWRDLERRWWTVQVDKKVGPFFFEVSSWWLSFNPVLPPVMFGVKIPSKYFRKLQREVSNLTSLVALFLTLIHAFHLGVPWYHSSTWIESINQWIPWVFPAESNHKNHQRCFCSTSWMLI